MVASMELLAERARRLGLSVQLHPFHPGQPSVLARANELRIWDTALAAPAVCGRPCLENAGCVLNALKRACQACLEGRFSALVTGPVQKSVIQQAGFAFSGHTEYLAQLCGVPVPVMLLAGTELRVALATTHIPLAEVPRRLNAGLLEAVLKVLHVDLARYYDLTAPRIRVLGLNPHAGEEGGLGSEERDWIAPLLHRLRAQGMNLEGPVPADTAFIPARRHGADVLLAMYHDQGLAALKALEFGQVVNLTLGLPILRTSVDHGTALPLAGTGQAQADSLYAAVRCACELSAQMERASGQCAAQVPG